MGFDVQDLDLILVPAGVLLMVTYNLFLIYRIKRYPATTAIGYENHNRMQWVECMMEGESSISLAITAISNNTWSAIYLGTITLSVSTLIGGWMGSSSGYLTKNVFIIGNTSETVVSLKYITTLFSFMLAFGSFAQAAKYFMEADYFITTPSADLPVRFVQSSMLKANNFWQIGFRLLYFAMAFLFWSFGPIPMLASCVIMVVLLSFLDYNSTPLHQFRPLLAAPVKKVMDEGWITHHDHV